MRKTSRGASRSQRRRRSKSPILQPPKFTYCSTATAAALSTPSGLLKHQRLAVPEAVEPHPAADGRTVSALNVPAQNELSCSGTPSHISPLVFGSRAGYETHVKAPSKDIPAATTSTRQDRASFRKACEEPTSGESACDQAECRAGEPRISGPADAADFRALSELGGSAQGPHAPCSCAWRASSDFRDESRQGPECRCQSQSDGQGWAGMEVYSFTGLRNVISECEMSLVSHDDAPRTTSTNGNAASPSTVSSGSPRSCSEQARGYVDDITIEDLSGYMEYYLYIPKKMSHMAEMMYT